MIRSGAIEQDIRLLESDPNILQVWNEKHRFSDVVDPETNVPDPDYLYAGFSWWPTVHRMDLYHQIEGGYTALTGNTSFGKGGATAELQILEYYRYNHYVYQGEIFFENRRPKNSGNKKVWNSKLDKEYKQRYKSLNEKPEAKEKKDKILQAFKKQKGIVPVKPPKIKSN